MVAETGEEQEGNEMCQKDGEQISITMGEEHSNGDTVSNGDCCLGNEIYRTVSSKCILYYYLNLGDGKEMEKECVCLQELGGIDVGEHGKGFTPVKMTMANPKEPSVSLKPSTTDAVQQLKRIIIMQIIYSILRNAGCYAFIGGVLYLIFHGEEFFQGLHAGEVDESVVVLIIICIGIIVVPFQLGHIFLHWKSKTQGPTEIATMLRNPVDQYGLLDIIGHLRNSAPYIGVEIRLHKQFFGQKPPVNEAARKLNTIIHYDVWDDISPPVANTRWRKDASGWMIISKDYRLLGVETEKWFREETEKFEQFVGYKKNKSSMSLEYVLDVQEGMKFADAQAFLVHPKGVQTSSFYSYRLYQVFLCLCLDSIYNVWFYFFTRKYDDQCIVKVVKRSAAHRDCSSLS